MITSLVRKVIWGLCKLTAAKGQPNINPLWEQVKDISVLRLNVKNFGYSIAQQLQPSLAAVDYSGEPRNHSVTSKATTQADAESPWFRYWCQQLKIAPIYHRKLWEFAFVLQGLFEQDILREGMEGIGFGCGEEPLASYFASRGMRVYVTDLDTNKAAKLGWTQSGQHTSTKEQAFVADIVSREAFDRNVHHRHVDMNNIPRFEKPFDFCWSICALEHLGSIRKGMDFIENSLSVLRPGGVAIHTTEFNYLSQGETIDNWPTVLFLRRHLEEMTKRLTDQAHRVLAPNFDVGNGILDRFIDVPPYAFGEGWFSRDRRADPKQNAHLKLTVDGFASTCFGFIVIKKIDAA